MASGRGERNSGVWCRERERGGEFMRDKNEYGKLGLMVSLL